MIKTEYTVNNEPISYEIKPNGYLIYLGDKPWISQYEPYIPDKDLSYEENCLAQMKEIVEGFNTPVEATEETPVE